MTDLEAEDLIKARWLSLWPTLQPGVPFTFENEIDAAAETWARVTVIPNVRTQETMGRVARMENVGRVFVQLFGPIGAGMAPLLELAADVRAIFERVRIGGVVLRAASPARPSSDGAWAQLTVSIPYWFADASTAQQV